MARPQGRSSFPSTNLMVQDFPIPSASACASPALQTVSPDSSSVLSSFGNISSSFVQPHIRTRIITSDPQSRQHLSITQPLPDDTLSLSDGGDHHHHHHHHLPLHPQATDLVQEDPLLNLAGAAHQPKVPSHKPWNPIDASMNHRPDHNHSLKSEPTKGHTPSDSGYGDSLRSRPFLQPNQSPLGSLEVSSAYLYDEPIDSGAPQSQYLREQSHLYPPLTIPNPTSPKPPSLAGAESITTPSGSHPARCDECGESFNTKSEMTKHMARHQKKYTCDYLHCPRSTDGFATKNDLDRHKASVHHDNTVTRKEYKCCVPGCKDPNKVWDRKDNFKAHVKRMHPDAEVDKVVDNSFIKQHAASDGGGAAGSHSVSHQDPHSQLLTPQQFPMASQLDFLGAGVGSDYNQTLDGHSPTLQYPYPTATHAYYPSPTIADMSQGVPADDDPYTLPGPSDAHPPQVSQQMNVDFSYASTVFGPSPAHHLSATTRPTHYGSTPTIAPPTSVPDQLHARSRRPQGPVRNAQMLSAQAALASSGLHADDSRSQPYPWASADDGSSAVVSDMPPIDPHLHIGSWDQASTPTNAGAMADASDRSSQPGLNLATDDPSTASPQPGQRVNDVVQRIEAYLEPFSPEERRQALEVYQRRSAVSIEKQNIVRRAHEAFAPAPQRENRTYKCGRSGCGKTFTANNIKTKHERRHDRLFFCTFDGCYSTFGTKDDLRRHEKRKHSKDFFEGFRCFKDDVQSSHYKPQCFKFFGSKDEFEQHRREEHRERAEKNNGGLKACKSCAIHQGSPGHYWCGFCNKVIQNRLDAADASVTEKRRLAHIDQHITKDKKTMEHWVDLKSGGKTKMQVKGGGDVHQSTNEDSQDDDDSESSPEAAATPAEYGQQTFTPVPPRQAAPTTAGVKRKRSAADAVDDVPARSAQMPRIDISPPEDVLGTPHTNGMPLFEGAYGRAPQQAQFLRCCNCRLARSINDGISCTCFHRCCPDCVQLDVLGRPIAPRTHSSTRRQSGG